MPIQTNKSYDTCRNGIIFSIIIVSLLPQSGHFRRSWQPLVKMKGIIDDLIAVPISVSINQITGNCNIKCLVKMPAIIFQIFVGSFNQLFGQELPHTEPLAHDSINRLFKSFTCSSKYFPAKHATSQLCQDHVPFCHIWFWLHGKWGIPRT